MGAVVVYDISNRDSFMHIAKWLEEAKANGPPSLTFILVGNKQDKQAEYLSVYAGAKSPIRKVWDSRRNKA